LLMIGMLSTRCPLRCQNNIRAISHMSIIKNDWLCNMNRNMRFYIAQCIEFRLGVMHLCFTRKAHYSLRLQSAESLQRQSLVGRASALTKAAFYHERISSAFIEANWFCRIKWQSRVVLCYARPELADREFGSLPACAPI
jgi:hypothetical protein